MYRRRRWTTSVSRDVNVIVTYVCKVSKKKHTKINNFNLTNYAATKYNRKEQKGDEGKKTVF